MSLFTRSMREVTAVTLQEDRENVIRALISRGTMDFVKLSDLEKNDKRLKGGTSSSKSDLEDFRTRLESLFSQGGILPPALTAGDMETVPDFNADRMRTFLDRVNSELQKVKDQQRLVNQRLIQYTEMLGYLKEEGGFLTVRTGSPKERKDEFLRRLSSDGAVTAENGADVTVISLTRDDSRIQEDLRKFGFEEAEAGKDPAKLVKAVLEEKTKAAEAELSEFSENAKKLVSEHRDEIDRAWRDVRVLELSEEVEGYFTYTRNTCLFSGWVPEDRYDDPTCR